MIASMMVISKGSQVALMCPTEALALQHYQGAVELFQMTSVRVELLLGSTSAKNKKIIYAGLYWSATYPFKEGKLSKKQKFEVLFNEYFSNDFDLYTKEDVINSNLFGKGKENEIFRDILGDYLAIAKTNKTLLYGGSEILKSQHAGYTDDEIYVPLIVINTNNI
jgi:hypothetical protein